MSSPRETSRLFTVVVPTRGRAESLRRCLAALAAQTFPAPEWNLIVVDDGGREDLTPVIAAVRETVQVDLLRQSHSGPAAARNAGAAAATGRYLVFTDDDCVPAPGWLAAFARGFEHAPEDMLGGSIVNGVQGNPYSEVSQALVSYLYDYYNGNGCVRFLTSNNIAMPLDRFRSLGGFSTGFRLAAGEDRDFCERWLRAGYRMRFVPDAVIEHHHVLRFRTFWAQHFNYGRGARVLHLARAGRGHEAIAVEPLRFYLGLLNYPFARWRFTNAVNRSALAAITQVANAAGYFYEALISRRREQEGAVRRRP